MKFNTTNQPIPTTLSDNEQLLLDEYTNKFSDVSHTTSSLSTSSGSNKVPHDSNYPSFSTGVALPVPSFTTYHDVHVFIQQNIPNMTHLIHSVKLGYFDDGFTKIDTALLLFTHNEQFTNTLLHELENIQPRKFLNNYFYIRNINQGIDLPANFGFYIPNEHEETMAQNFMVRQAKLNCDHCTNSIDRLRSIIITSTTRTSFSMNTSSTCNPMPKLATTTATQIITTKEIKIDPSNLTSTTLQHLTKGDTRIQIHIYTQATLTHLRDQTLSCAPIFLSQF